MVDSWIYFAALGNLALHVESTADVIAERERLSQYLGISLDSWVVGSQIHKANIQRVKPSDKGRGAVDHASAFTIPME